MSAKVVPTAKMRPGKCAITGDTTGPFIDTKVKIARYGTLYLSIRGLADVLRPQGFLSPEETEALREDNDRLQEEVRRLTEIENDYHTLVDSVSRHIEVEPEIREVKQVTERAPTDDEIEDWIERKGGDHPAVIRARPYEKGSSEEWRELYGDIPPGHPEFSKAPATSNRATLAQELASKDAGSVVQVTKTGTRVVEIHEQDVDLYQVLDQNVNDVMAWAEGHDENVQEMLIDAEYVRAKEQNRNPRKSLIEGLGYEYEEEDQEVDLSDVEDEDE